MLRAWAGATSSKSIELGPGRPQISGPCRSLESGEIAFHTKFAKLYFFLSYSFLSELPLSHFIIVFIVPCYNFISYAVCRFSLYLCVVYHSRIIHKFIDHSIWEIIEFIYTDKFERRESIYISRTFLVRYLRKFLHLFISLRGTFYTYGMFLKIGAVCLHFL